MIIHEINYLVDCELTQVCLGERIIAESSHIYIMNELAVHKIGLWIIVALRSRQLNCCRLDGCRLLRMHTGLIICLKCRQQLRLSALMWEHIGCLNPLDFQFNSTLTLISCTIHKSKSTHFSFAARKDVNVSELTHGAQRRPSLCKWSRMW